MGNPLPNSLQAPPSRTLYQRTQTISRLECRVLWSQGLVSSGILRAVHNAHLVPQAGRKGDLKIALRGGGDMNARRRRGLEKWTSVPGPLTRGSFVGLFENHLEERLLDQALDITSLRGVGGGQKFLLRRLQAVGTHIANTQLLVEW